MGYRARVAQREATLGTSGSFGRESPGGDQPIELRRLLEALRRSLLLIATIMLAITGATLVLSLILPKTYTASAKLVFDPTQNPTQATDSASVERTLATVASLVTTPSVLDPVAAHHGLTEAKLKKKVTATADASANLIHISASDRKPGGAASLANDVATSFTRTRVAADQKNITGAKAKVLEEITRLRAVPASNTQLQALRARLSDLDVAFAQAGSELTVAEDAQKPSAASSPRPVLNTILALFASTLLGVLIAIGRDQLLPRLSGPRELSRITDRPVLVGIPFRRRFGRYPKVLPGAEHEAYQTLQATIRFQLPPEEQHIILVTSGVESEGKTSVTMNLGRALARAGHKTLVISADMRRPKLHELADVPVAPGLSEILGALEREGDASTARTIAAVKSLLNANAGAKGNLHVLASGEKPSDPARLLLSDALPALFRELQQMGYSYVLLDGTPLLGIADAQVMAQRVDSVLLVSRLDRISLDNVVEMRDLLDRLEVTPLGHVVVGVRRSVSYYYATAAPEAAEHL